MDQVTVWRWDQALAAEFAAAGKAAELVMALAHRHAAARPDVVSC